MNLPSHHSRATSVLKAPTGRACGQREMLSVQTMLPSRPKHGSKQKSRGTGMSKSHQHTSQAAALKSLRFLTSSSMHIMHLPDKSSCKPHMEGFNSTRNVGFNKFLLPVILNTNPLHMQQLMTLSKLSPALFPSQWLMPC